MSNSNLIQQQNQASIHRSFAGAMMSNLITDFVFKGINGTPHHINLDLIDTSLAAFQGGVSYVSYQAAVETLVRLSDKFREIKEDPKNRSQAIVYIGGGSLAALYATGINYPIDCLREFRNFNKNMKKTENNVQTENKPFNISLTGAEKFFTDRVFGYIGFATSMGNIIPMLSKPKSSIHKWTQTHFLIQMSHLNGILIAYPYQMLRYNVKFVPYVKNYLKSVARKMISSDLSSHFKREINGIPFMAI